MTLLDKQKADLFRGRILEIDDELRAEADKGKFHLCNDLLDERYLLSEKIKKLEQKGDLPEN